MLVQNWYRVPLWWPNTCVAERYTEAENAEVAELITDLRSRRGLTQAELCTQAGLSLYTVHRLERGNHVRPATMKLIIEALGRFERVPRKTAERIAEIYRFSAKVIDPSALSEGPGFDAVAAATTKDLHLLLDRALNTVGQLPSIAQQAAVQSIHGLLAVYAGETRPIDSTTLAKRNPPERVGDWEVEVVEPASPPPAPKKKSG